MKRRNTAHLFVMPCTIWLAFIVLFILHLVILLFECLHISHSFRIFLSVLCLQLISNGSPLLHFVDVGTKYMTHLLRQSQGPPRERRGEREKNVKNSSRLCKCQFTLNGEITSVCYQIAIDVYGATISSAHPFMVKTGSFATTKASTTSS